MMIEEGIIEIDKAPASWGFTRERFEGDSYLWKSDRMILVSFIVAHTPGKGHFSELIRAIEADGFQVGIPTPLKGMQGILFHLGFAPKTVRDVDIGEDVQVWTRKNELAHH